ncbi:flagellar assembly protein T N-terminal domain-containing protein [Aliidiomarina sp. Khilg15.8]
MRHLLPVWLLLLTVSVSAQAEWYESKGWAPIINNDTESARARAAEMALRQSLDFAGGSVHSVEEVVDGVLTGQQMQWRTQGAVEHAELVRERTNGQRLELTLRAFIRQQSDECTAASMRKSVAIVPFELAPADQARAGHLWDLGEAASKRFAQMLSQRSRVLTLEHSLQRKVGFTRLLASDNTQEMASFARHVGIENDAQYVIAGVFEDISTVDRSSLNLTFWTHPKQDRNLALTLYLFDASSGELITRAGVRETLAWDFDFNQSVDAHSQEFWNSDYGQVLAQRLQDTTHGFDDKLRCEPVRARVVAVQGEDIQINLGERHGLSTEHELQLYHRGNFTDAQGIYREQWVLSPYALQVVQVARGSARTRVTGDETGTNIQVNDRVVVR